MIQTDVFDGSDKVIFNGTYSVYENKLTLSNVLGYKINFIFKKEENRGSDINVKGNNQNKTVNITLYNFENVLGLGSKEKVLFMRSNDKDVKFSLTAKSFGEDSSLIQMGVTIYESK